MNETRLLYSRIRRLKKWLKLALEKLLGLFSQMCTVVVKKQYRLGPTGSLQVGLDSHFDDVKKFAEVILVCRVGHIKHRRSQGRAYGSEHCASEAAGW